MARTNSSAHFSIFVEWAERASAISCARGSRADTAEWMGLDLCWFVEGRFFGGRRG